MLTGHGCLTLLRIDGADYQSMRSAIELNLQAALLAKNLEATAGSEHFLSKFTIGESLRRTRQALEVCAATLRLPSVQLEHPDRLRR